MDNFKLFYFNAVSILAQSLLILSGIAAIVTAGGSLFSLGILPGLIYFYLGKDALIVFIILIPISSIILAYTTMMREIVDRMIENLKHKISERKTKEK